MHKLRIAVVTNVLPHYREAFYAELFQRQELDVTVYCQESIPGMSLRTVHEKFPERVRLVRSASAPRELVGWQRLPWRELLGNYDMFFVMGNPRILSSVAFASTALLLGRPVVLWGQAHTAGANRITERLRLAWWRCFRNLFVYTDREVEWLRQRGFSRQHIVGMNNGLDQKQIDAVASGWSPDALHSWLVRNDLVGRTMILSCARLEPKNEFELWLDAIPSVLQRFPGVLWCVIGEGRERERLQTRAAALGVEKAIRWLGAILDEADLAPWFLSSQFLIHPAGIGLTLLHAFGYGLPVITNGDPESQMPEFGAFTPGETGKVFRRGDTNSLAQVVCSYLDEPEQRGAMSAIALQVAREQYNVSVMVERFARIAADMGAGLR